MTLIVSRYYSLMCTAILFLSNPFQNVRNSPHESFRNMKKNTRKEEITKRDQWKKFPYCRTSKMAHLCQKCAVTYATNQKSSTVCKQSQQFNSKFQFALETGTEKEFTR